MRTEARRYFRQGMALIAAGQLDRGIARLQQAYETLPHPNVLYNIARAYAEAGRYEEAIEYFQRYLDSDPPDREEVEGFIAAMERRVGAQRARRREAGTAEPRQPTQPAEELGPAATPEQIQALEDSATQIEAIAERRRSGALRQRAERLRRLAESLRRRNELASAVETGGTTTGGTGTTAEQGTEGGDRGEGDDGLELGGTAGEGIYEERILSASRFVQSPLDAANSTTIVTAQDIRLTGHTNAAALLRRAAGVEVMELAPEHDEVSIRGLNRRFSNKVLVLVDGRSGSLDFLGGTFWELLPTSIEDIERIEVIRGPASALYGADAFTGVVNIITRDPAESHPSWVSIGAGNGDRVRAATGISGRTGQLSYRFGGGYEQADHYSVPVAPGRVDAEPFADDPDQSLQRHWFDAELRYRFGKGWVARGGAAVTGGLDSSLRGIGRLRNADIEDATFTQTFVALTAPFGMTLRSFWNRLDASAGQSVLVPGAINVVSSTPEQNVVDVEMELSRKLDLLVPHTAAVGVGYRFKSIEHWSWLDADHTQNHFSAYLRDILQIADPLRVQLSFRADRHPLLENVQLSPHGALVIRPTEGSAIHASVGTAFRAPTFLESYLDLRNPTPLSGAIVDAQGSEVAGEDLEPESILSAEIGYRNADSEYFDVEVAAYYQRVSDLIVLSQIDPYELHHFVRDDAVTYDPAAAAFPVGTITFRNEEAVYDVIGGEVGTRVYPVRGLDVYANYAINQAYASDPSQEDREEERTSTHRINVGVQYRYLFGLYIAMDFHWVSDQTWVEPQFDVRRGVVPGEFDLDGYYLINARVGYRLFDDALELAITGFNVTDNRHRQHPYGQVLSARYLATATYRF